MTPRSSRLYSALTFNLQFRKSRHDQGVAMAHGGYMGIYIPPPKKKISPSKLLWGKNDVRTAIQQFYTPLHKKTQKKNSGYAPGHDGDLAGFGGLTTDVLTVTVVHEHKSM